MRVYAGEKEKKQNSQMQLKAFRLMTDMKYGEYLKLYYSLKALHTSSRRFRINTERIDSRARAQTYRRYNA